MVTSLLRISLVLSLYLLLFQQTAAARTEMEQAKIWFESGQTKRALKLLRKVHLREQSYNFTFNYAYYLSLDEQTEKAIQLFNNLIASNPKRYEADLELAFLYERLGAYETASVVLEQAVERGGNENLNIISKYAAIQLHFGQTEKAINILKTYHPKKEELVQYLGIWASANFDHGNYQEALVSYNKLVRLKPESKYFHFLLANTYRRMAQYSKAEIIYEELKNAYPSDAKIWFENATLYGEMTRFDEALVEMKEAKKLYTQQEDIAKAEFSEKTYNEILLQKANFLMKKQDFARACPLLNKLYMKTSKKDYGLRTAYCFITANQFEAAEMIYVGLIESFPAEIDVYLEYYDVLRKVNLDEKAREILEIYIDKYGYNEQKIIARLASVYIAEKDYRSALDILHVGQPPDKEPYLSFLFLSGIAYSKLKDPDKALNILEQVASIAPELIKDPKDLLVAIQDGNDIGYQGIILFETYNQFGLSPTILIKRASFYLVIKNWDKAMEDSQKLLNDSTIPEDSYIRSTAKAIILECKIGLGLDYSTQGNLSRSVELFQEVYLQDPSPRNALNYAYFSSIINRSDRSEVILLNLRKTNPDHPEIALMMSEILLREHRADEVLEYLPVNIGFNHVYDEQMSNLLIKALFEQGLLSEMEETLEAIRVLKGALPLSLKPYDAALQTEYGNFLQTLNIWRDIAEQMPEDAGVQLEVISSFMKLQRYEDAELLFQQLLLKFNDEPIIWLHWTRFLLNRNRIPEAKKAGKKTKQLLQKEHSDFWTNLGRLLLLSQVHATLGEFDEAEEILKHVLELSPHHFQAHNQLAYLYIEKDDFSNAEEFFLKTEKLQPQNPYTKPALASVYMKANHPGKSRYWEREAIPSAKKINHGVEQLRSNSLGVFGYRPLDGVGTQLSFARITARPNAMMLVRESLFSDQPLTGFEINQTILKGSVGYFAPQLPGFWLNYLNVQNSNSIETSLNIFEPEVHGALSFPQGLLTIRPKASFLFENFKNSEKSQKYTLGTLNLNWKPTSSRLVFGNQTTYGVQRIDNFQVPGEFFQTTASASWRKGEQSIAEEMSFRHDQTSDGLEFSTFITGTSYRQKIGSSLFINTYLKTETLFQTGDDSRFFGLEPILSLETSFFDQNAFPYVSFHPSFSFVEGNISTMKVYQYEWGLIYQNKTPLPTKVDDEWYQYDIPYRIQISLQQTVYPNLPVLPSQALFFTFRAI